MQAMGIILLVMTSLKLCPGEENVPEVNQRKVKGQQFVTQTLVAKVVGSSGFSDDFLEMLRNDSNVPIVVDNTTLIDGPNGTTSALITENIKTTVTRITIPLSTNFMDSDWYRETLKKFLQKNRFALKNSSIGEKEYNDDGPDIDLVILKLWAAATLRDNVITVFGTLLYNTDHPLPGDLHSSLVHLLNLIRLRRISTIGFLDALEKMSFENPQEQFKILFQKLEKQVPKYLKSCVTYWLENLYINGINISNLLTNREGVLVTDFLSGIDSSALYPVRQKVLFPKKTVMGGLPRNEALLGKILSYVLSGVADKSIKLTRQLFAGILLHLPLNKLVPQAEEYERFFVDLVKKSNVSDENDFLEAISGLNFRDFIDPYEMVKNVFKALLAHNLEHREIYESILISIPKITNTFAIQDYDVMAPIMSSPKISMDVLLSSIVPEEYPLDIVDAKDRLLYYIDKNYIDLDFVLRGFIKHQQATPTELLIAALARIEIRSPNLSPELLSTVSSLKAHVVYKKALNNLRLTLSVVDVTTLLRSFQSPNLPKNLRGIAGDLQVLLQSEFIDVDNQLNKQSTAQCSRPRQCVINILKYLLAKGQIRNKVCETRVRELLRLVDQYGEPITAQRSLGGGVNCMDGAYGRPKSSRMEIAGRSLSVEEPVQSFDKEIYPGKYNPSPYKNRRNAYEKPIYISRLDSGKVLITGQSGEVFFASSGPELMNVHFDRVPLPHPGWINDDNDVRNLIPHLSRGEKKYLEPVELLLSYPNLTSVLNITPADYSTKGSLLVQILNTSLSYPYLFNNDTEMTFVHNYLNLLEYTYTVLPPPPPVTSQNQKHEVDLIALLQAVPVPTDEISMERLETLKSFFTQADLTTLTSEIDTNRYPSKGGFLKYLLHLLLVSDYPKNERVIDSIRYFEGKVMTTGYGAQPVDWIIVVGNIPNSIGVQ